MITQAHDDITRSVVRVTWQRRALQSLPGGITARGYHRPFTRIKLMDRSSESDPAR